MASPDHISYLTVAHAGLLPDLHASVLVAFEGEGGAAHPLDFQVGFPGVQSSRAFGRS